MQHPLPKKVGCTHACVTVILAMNSPPTSSETPLLYTPGIEARIRTARI